MPITLTDAAVAAIFTDTLTDMRNWLTKAAVVDEATLMAARLAPDMLPFPAQYQIAADTAKGAIARLAGVAAPARPDIEKTLAELAARCDSTIAFIASVDIARLDGGEDRPVELRFPNGMGYRFDGARYLLGFALPNFFFHATTAYAILRHLGVPLGKPDFLAHLGPPNLTAPA